jgi:hypothetical protein
MAGEVEPHVYQARSRAPYGPYGTTRQKAQAREVRSSVMSNRPEERLDRRDFMIASIATAGASAALAVAAGTSNARLPSH